MNGIEWFNQLTLRRPGIFPKYMTGAMPHALVKAGIGALVGRYVLPPIMSQFLPDADEDRVKTVGTLGGAMAGFGTSLPDLWVTSRIGGTANVADKDNDFSYGDAISSLFNNDDVTPVPPLKKSAGFWDQPVAQQPYEISAAVRTGNLDPVSGALLMTSAQRANDHASMTGTMTSALIGAGAAFVPAYAAARMGSAVLGAMGAAPTNPNTFAVKMGLLAAVGGAIANAIR